MTQTEIDFFNRLAPSWDENEVRSTPERVKSILGKLPFRKNMHVLDLGTGTGILIPYLVDLIGAGGHVTAIDLSEGMLSIAKRKNNHLKNVDFLSIDFEEEVIPGEYDIIMLYSVYPHLHSPEETFKWLFKMNIRKGGMIVVAFPSDEKFINNIHHERKSESDHLPSAPLLASIIAQWGYKTEILADSDDEYIVTVQENCDLN